MSVIFVAPGKPPRLLGDGSYTLIVKVTQLRLLRAATESPDRWLSGWDPELASPRQDWAGDSTV